YFFLYQRFRQKTNYLIGLRNRLIKNEKYKEICFFGAKDTVYYRRLLKLLAREGINKPLFFVDNTSARWGTKLDDKDIFPPEVLRERSGSCLVIVLAYNHFDSIAEQLSVMGYYRDIDVLNPREFFFEEDIERIIAL
ncbi:MAG: hypothetical protein IJ873_03025, partial [Lachnospiraceae bacterium]|nr:hypothetical protein [Lachnospiraceae bacterium]